MHYWYTGESLVAGNGRMIQRVESKVLALPDFIVAAHESYKTYSSLLKGVSKETYSAAYIAAIAMHEFGESNTVQNFTSLKQIYKLFYGLNIEQVAVNFLNGRTASNYQSDNIGGQLTQGFVSGELLFLPRDDARLHLPQALNKLPGIIVFLLTKSEVQRKSFNNYLRYGISPILTRNNYLEIANARVVIPSFAKEIREEKAMQQRGRI